MKYIEISSQNILLCNSNSLHLNLKIFHQKPIGFIVLKIFRLFLHDFFSKNITVFFSDLDLQSFTFHPDTQLVLRHIAMSHLSTKTPGLPKKITGTFQSKFKKLGARIGAKKVFLIFNKISGRRRAAMCLPMKGWMD